MRLIDADKLRKDVLDLPDCYNGFSDTYDKARILDLVDEQMTVDAEPVKHGEWIPKITDFGTMVFRCSACRRFSDIHWAYCPQCGTKMDGGKERKWED